METDNEIYFYSNRGKYGYMSNFYKSDFKIDNIKYCCNEQYFMYKKCEIFDSENEELKGLILEEYTPSIIKKYGRMVKNYDEKKWNKIRYKIMLKGLEEKFKQNEDIRILLKKTGNKILYEASKYDKIWGIGYYANDAINISKTKYGRNLLGKALMEIRDMI